MVLFKIVLVLEERPSPTMTTGNLHASRPQQNGEQGIRKNGDTSENSHYNRYHLTTRSTVVHSKPDQALEPVWLGLSQWPVGGLVR